MPNALARMMPASGYYRVKVSTKQPATQIKSVLSDGTIKISLRAVPEQGKANAELREFIAAELQLPRTAVRIASGLTSPIKVVHISYDS